MPPYTKDTFVLKFPGADNYQETFEVKSLTAGLKFKNLFLDYGIIQTYYDFAELGASKITVMSAAYVWDRFMFNLAQRNENSKFPKYNYESKIFEEGKTASELYGGVQYSLNRFAIIGFQYNYFLMREVSFSAVVFF